MYSQTELLSSLAWIPYNQMWSEKTYWLTQLTAMSGIDTFLICIYDEKDFKVCRKKLTAWSRCIDSTVGLNLETLITAALKQRGIVQRGAYAQWKNTPRYRIEIRNDSSAPVLFVQAMIWRNVPEWTKWTDPLSGDGCVTTRHTRREPMPGQW